MLTLATQLNVQLAAVLLLLSMFGRPVLGYSPLEDAVDVVRRGWHLITFNVGNGRATPASNRRVRRDVRALMKRGPHAIGPHAIGLQEINNRRRVLRRLARRHGWQLVQHKGGPGHLGALIHPSCRVAHRRVVKLNDRTYVGRNVAGSRITGRAPARWALIVELIAPDGSQCVVIVAHLVPSAGRKGNHLARALHARQTEKLAELYEQQHLPAYLLADSNAAANRDAERPMLAALERVGDIKARPSLKGRAIDIVLVPTGTKGDIEAIEGLTSEHRPNEWRESA